MISIEERISAMLLAHGAGSFGRRIVFLSLAMLLFLLAGCGVRLPMGTRLQQDFEAESLAVGPARFPAPTPPGDDVIFNSTPQGHVQPTVVKRGDYGKWVMIRAKEAFAVGTVDRAQAMVAVSERFARSGADFLGKVTLRLDGAGSLMFAVLPPPTAGPRRDPLGGFDLYVGPGSGAGLSSSVGYLESRAVSDALRATLPGDPRPGGTFLGKVTPGQLLQVSWSVNQASRKFYLSVSGVGARQVTFPAVSSEGARNTPLEGVQLLILLYDFGPSTALFVDNLLVTELLW
jgi:hypothetical protein